MKIFLVAMILAGVIIVTLTSCRTVVPYDPFPTDPTIPPDCTKIDCE